MRSKGHRRHGGSWVPRQGRPSQAIIEGNRKTELCRNWESKGVCSFGARCAFAHGDEELRYRTLREMENAGRIPDASKYRCYPCMTWVATGSCPYSSRCVFIHDPRIKGPREAWLYAGSQGKGQSAYPSSDNCFFFPDMVRDPDTLELPTHPARYDLEPFMARAQDVGTRAVYSLWYSFLSTLLEAATKNNTALTTLWSSSSSSGGGGGGRKTSGGRSSSSNSSISRAPSNHTYKEAVVAPTSDSSRASADRALLPRPQLPRRAASVTTIPAAAAAAAAATRGGGTVESSVAAPPLALKRCASLPPTLAREMVPIPCEEVQHLPVFSCLSRGVPARAVTTPFSGRTSAEALQLDGAPGRFDPSKRASSSTWNGVPPEFLLDALAPPASSCPKTKHVISDGAPRCRAFIDVTDVPDGTTAVSPGSNSGSNTNSTATFSPPSTLSPSSSDCGQFSRRNISFPPSRGKTALGNGIVIGDEPHCWSLYGGEGLAIGETVPPEPRGSLKAAAPAASSDRVSSSRVRNGYAVVHHRKQQLQEQQQQRQLQQHNRVGVDAAMQTSVSSLFALPSF